MKLLYLANMRMPTEMAHGVQIAKACEAFTVAGADVELIVPRRYTPITEEPFAYYGVKTPFSIRFLPTPDVVRNFGRFGFLLQIFFFGVAAARYIRTQKYGVVYCRDEHVLFLVLLLGIKRVVWESHDGAWNLPAQYVVRHTKHMVVVTDAQRKWYIAHGVSEEKIIALPNGIDIDAFAHTESKETARARLGLPQDAFIALYVGALGGWKGTDTLFLSASLLPEHIRVAVIGGVLQQREASALQYPKVIFLGERPYRELQDNLAAADLCILPNTAHDPISVSFTSPLKLLAYMASGKPIVASDLPSVRELTGDDAALLVEPDSPRALAAGIEQVAGDAVLARRLAQNALADVQGFDWRTRAEHLLAFIA